MPFSLEKGKEAEMNHTLVLRDHIGYGICPAPLSKASHWTHPTIKGEQIFSSHREALQVTWQLAGICYCYSLIERQ